MYKVDVGVPLRQLVSDIIECRKNGDMQGILNLLDQMTQDPGAIMDAMPNFDTDEVLLYVDDDVTVYYVATTPNIQYPPHEHGMIAISALYKGTETHIFYDPDGENVKERSRVTFEAPAVIDMDIDCMHAICTGDDEPNQSLHFYLGDLETQRRRLWNIDGSDPRQYVHQDYLDSAKEF